MIDGIHDYWLFAVSAGRIRYGFVRRPAAYTWLTRASGALFIVLGARLAVSDQ